MTMKVARRILVAVVLVTLSMACASASTCANVTLNNYLTSGFSCTITTGLDTMTFSNFYVLFSGFHGGVAPDPLVPANSDVFVTPETNTNSAGFLFTFANNNYVAYNQGMSLDINYTVSTTTNYAIDSVFTQATGGTVAPGGLVTTAKNLCLSGSFDHSNPAGFASNSCIGAGSTSLPGTSPTSAFTLGSITNPAQNDLWGTEAITNTTSLGVSDMMVLTAGSTTLSGHTAQLNQVQNMFNDVLIQTGVPEPATFLLLGSALLGLGVLRRKRV
jgi:hypothetical protein